VFRRVRIQQFNTFARCLYIDLEIIQTNRSSRSSRLRQLIHFQQDIEHFPCACVQIQLLIKKSLDHATIGTNETRFDSLRIVPSFQMSMSAFARYSQEATSALSPQLNSVLPASRKRKRVSNAHVNDHTKSNHTKKNRSKSLQPLRPISENNGHAHVKEPAHTIRKVKQFETKFLSPAYPTPCLSRRVILAESRASPINVSSHGAKTESDNNNDTNVDDADADADADADDDDDDDDDEVK
jgi:hypothetical protein